MYVVCVTFELLPQHFRDFLHVVQLQAVNSLEQESDCHRFDVCQAADRHTIFLYEIYSDQAAFDAHLQSTHCLEFNSKTIPWVNHKKVETWQLLEQSK